jgi:hypothetical protein
MYTPHTFSNYCTMHHLFEQSPHTHTTHLKPTAHMSTTEQQHCFSRTIVVSRLHWVSIASPARCTTHVLSSLASDQHERQPNQSPSGWLFPTYIHFIPFIIYITVQYSTVHNIISLYYFLSSTEDLTTLDKRVIPLLFFITEASQICPPYPCERPEYWAIYCSGGACLGGISPPQFSSESVLLW